MTEIAFLVKPDSEMYRKYFKQKNELDKFVGFASAFIDKYFASRNKGFDYSFSTNMRLTVNLPHRLCTGRRLLAGRFECQAGDERNHQFRRAGNFLGSRFG